MARGGNAVVGVEPTWSIELVGGKKEGSGKGLESWDGKRPINPRVSCGFIGYRQIGTSGLHLSSCGPSARLPWIYPKMGFDPVLDIAFRRNGLSC